MSNISILIPVCSRNQNYDKIEDTPLIKTLIPSISLTKETEHDYDLFIGYDTDDIFYQSNHDFLQKLNLNVYRLEGCSHAPAWAWNKLFQIALEHKKNYDYFFQIGDDIEIKTVGWASRFISKLKEHNDIGVVGPVEPSNYQIRTEQQLKFVIENAFVSRKHHDIFGYFFHPKIKNYYCDDWITRVYDKHNLAFMDTDVIVKNQIRYMRYNVIDCKREINDYIEETHIKIHTHTNTHV